MVSAGTARLTGSVGLTQTSLEVSPKQNKISSQQFCNNIVYLQYVLVFMDNFLVKTIFRKYFITMQLLSVLCQSLSLALFSVSDYCIMYIVKCPERQ